MQTIGRVLIDQGEVAEGLGHLDEAIKPRHRATIEREAAATFPALADLYSRIPETESAMERRGPANSIKDDDRRLIEGWEGDARAARRSLREVLHARPLAGWKAAMARLRASLASR